MHPTQHRFNGNRTPQWLRKAHQKKIKYQQWQKRHLAANQNRVYWQQTTLLTLMLTHSVACTYATVSQHKSSPLFLPKPQRPLSSQLNASHTTSPKEALQQPTPVAYSPSIPSIRYQDFSGSMIRIFDWFGPQLRDIEQGYVGTCSLLATLASLTQTAPHLIEQKIQRKGPLRESAIRVSFCAIQPQMQASTLTATHAPCNQTHVEIPFGTYMVVEKNKQQVVVGAQLATSIDGYSTVTWVNLFETALVKYCTLNPQICNRSTQQLGTYISMLHGFHIPLMHQLLLGHWNLALNWSPIDAQTQTSSIPIAEYRPNEKAQNIGSQSPEHIFKRIQTWLSEGMIITVTTPEKSNIATPCIQNRHAYALLGTDAHQKVLLFNPHGFTQHKTQCQQHLTQNFIGLSIQDFLAHFSQMFVTHITH